MDGIRPYAPAVPAPAPPPAPARAYAAPAALHANPAAQKVASDYARALRRRVWLVLAVGVPLSAAASVWAVRQPAVYRAATQVIIEPPQYDPVLSALVSREVGRRDPESVERYIPNRIARLRSKAMAERVVNDPAFLQGSTPPDPGEADEFLSNLQARTLPNSNYVAVSLDGYDPVRTARQLASLLEIFEDAAKREKDTANDAIKEYAGQGLRMLQEELTGIDNQIDGLLRKSDAIGPGGRNVFQAQYENVGAILLHKRMRLDEFQQQSWVSQLVPKFSSSPDEDRRAGQIEGLQQTRRRLTLQLREYKGKMRNFENDPSVKHTRTKLEMVLDDLEQLQNRVPKQASTDPSEMIFASMREEIHAAEEASKAVLAQLKESMPEHQQFLSLQEARAGCLKRITDMKTKLGEFDVLSQSQKPTVTVFPVAEATLVKPRRLVNIAAGIVLSFGLGAALVCLLEHLDHSVKVPEHLTLGLTLPLLGVVPRIRRTAMTHRGGHLWTPGDPGSSEADAYRNLRASLLGASDRLGPIVTLLVTSAKAGEGKSTTALNLAATCARAGERTLLMDVDLRRPSLAGAFRDEDGHDLGLVDVLRGELPWQRTVVRTDLPNLDFLPTGDTRAVPIEILGTLELRQLLVGLAGHYDRVILDGPAVLGLADCRMLGRVVDAAVLVVRSGTHEMRPLQRAKAMLEQSGVVLAGLVFNGLYEDLQNWSSYGPYDEYGGTAPALGGGLAALPAGSTGA